MAGKYNLQVYLLQGPFSELVTFGKLQVLPRDAPASLAGLYISKRQLYKEFQPIYHPIPAFLCFLFGLWIFAGAFTEWIEEPLIRRFRSSGDRNRGARKEA